MSEENVELQRRGADAFHRRDLDAFLALCDPEIEFISRLVEVDGGGPYRGHGGLRSWWRDLLGASPDFSGEIEQVLNLGDVTVARLHLRGHGVGSDASVEHTSWFVTEWHNGKAVWWGVFRSESEAFEAAGRRE